MGKARTTKRGGGRVLKMQPKREMRPLRQGARRWVDWWTLGCSFRPASMCCFTLWHHKLRETGLVKIGRNGKKRLWPGADWGLNLCAAMYPSNVSELQRLAF
jgi:hypothetical protein